MYSQNGSVGVARRATPTDPFWEYIGPENWDRAFGLLRAERESRALELAGELDARYVVVGPGETQGRIADRLYRFDGLRTDRHPALRRFRLVTEGPRGGLPIQALFASADRPEDFVPYKLFEIVRGARLDVPAPAGARVEARVEVRTPAGRSFVYRTAVRASEAGRAILVAPYANPQPGEKLAPEAVRPAAVWRIAIDGVDAGSLVVTERDVLDGALVAFRAGR